jgi:antirestriction protein ArdC
VFLLSQFPGKVQKARDQLVDRLVSDMQTKGLEWTREWSQIPTPYNPLTGTKYKGGNRLHLTLSGIVNDYTDPRWVTFNQATNAGWQLNKDSKGSVVERWKVFYYRVDEFGMPAEKITPEEAANLKNQCLPVKEYLRCVGYWTVFNAQQFKNAPDLSTNLLNVREYKADAINEMADNYIASSRCKIIEQPSDRAYYSPAYDEIVVPRRTQFSSNEAFMQTLWHEMVHSTAHPDTNASRTTYGRRENLEAYAQEELVAELGSVFIASDMGLALATDPASAHYQNHVAYLQSWCSALQNDSSYVFKAAAVADKATDYLTQQYEKTLLQETNTNDKFLEKKLERQNNKSPVKERISLNNRVASLDISAARSTKTIKPTIKELSKMAM